MKILFIWKNDYPWDIRVEKMCSTLIDFGHEVHMLARNLRKEKIEENINGIYVHRLRPFKNKSLNSLFSTPVIYNPIWQSEAYKLCKSYDIELIIIRDLPLVYSGIKVGKKLGIPTIFDMAEDYPAMWWDVIRDKWYKLHNYLFKNPVLGRLIEKYCMKNVDHILVVVDESRDRLIKLGIDAKKISMVSNTPDLKLFKDLQEHPHKKDQKYSDKIVMLYQGYVNRSRGLDIVIRSMPKLVEKLKNIYFVIAGDGKYIMELKTLSKDLDVDDNVLFLGWVNFQKIPLLIKESDICLIPHYKTFHKETTIPNKLFDYMAFSKPVVVSDSRPLKRIVENEKCGVVFESRDEESFINSIEYLIDNPSVFEEMGSNGRKAVEQKYSWEYDSEVLKQAVERFENV